MPWTRPVLKKWNSTMLEVITVMRNHSWQSYTRYYFPRVVRYTAEPIESDIYVTAWFLRHFPSNTTLNQKQMNSSFTYPMRINYTQFLHLWAEGYINMTACSLNATRNATEFILNGTYNFTVLAVNITTNWTQTFYNFTFTLVNSTASFVNGSLVNETIFHNAHLPKYFYFNLMNFTMNITDHAFNYSMCMLDQTLREYVNKTLSPVITTWRTLKALNELKPEDIVEMLQPKSKSYGVALDSRRLLSRGHKQEPCLYNVVTQNKRHLFSTKKIGWTQPPLTSNCVNCSKFSMTDFLVFNLQ